VIGGLADGLRFDRLVAVYITVTTSPRRTSIAFCSGAKRHGRPPVTLASKRTVILRSSTLPGPLVATWVVPANPVVRQNQL